MFRKEISRLLSRFPVMFYMLKRTELSARWHLGKLYERDYLATKAVISQASSPVIVDVGANIGQSAIDFSLIFPNAKIFSFEANVHLQSYLDFCKGLIGDRFNYRTMGLSDKAEDLILYIPKRNNAYIYGEASVDPEQFEDEVTKRRLGINFSLEQQCASLITFDSTGIEPDLVKIDVQGHEMSVLHGMRNITDKCRPIFVIERSPDENEIMEFFAQFGGYEFFVASDCYGLIPFSKGSEKINYFCIPNEIMERSRAST